MKKFIAALLAVLVAATSAAAYPPPPPPRRYGPPPPPPPPHHHRHPHDYCDDAALFGGLAVGLMIGALASSQQDQAAAREAEQQRVFERETAEVREAARKLAEAQSVNVTEIISKLGPDHALEDLDNYWQAHGQPTLQDVNRPPRTLKIAGFSQNMRLLYDIDRERSTVTVTVVPPAVFALFTLTLTLSADGGKRRHPEMRSVLFQRFRVQLSSVEIAFVDRDNGLYTVCGGVYQQFVHKKEIGFGLAGDKYNHNVHVCNVRPDKFVFSRQDTVYHKPVFFLGYLDEIAYEYHIVSFYFPPCMTGQRASVIAQKEKLSACLFNYSCFHCSNTFV